jgi:hypothetical protein
MELELELQFQVPSSGFVFRVRVLCSRFRVHRSPFAAAMGREH